MKYLSGLSLVLLVLKLLGFVSIGWFVVFLPVLIAATPYAIAFGVAIYTSYLIEKMSK